MHDRVLHRVIVLLLAALAAAALARAQHDGVAATAHGAPLQTLFTARAVPEEVPGRARGRDGAAATGAFTLSADAKAVAYEITWDGLERPQGLTIDLHNFGAGAAGKRVAVLCGPNSPCPVRRGGTIRGTWAIPRELVRELAAERIYLDFHTAAARDGALRGQLLPLPWMVHSRQFVLHLTRPGTRAANGTGTFFVTPFPQFTQLQFDLTVVALPADEVTVEVRRGQSSARLPLVSEAARRRGGTISGIAKSGRGAAALTPALLDVIGTEGAEVIVSAQGQVIASGRLVPVS